jgi:hypothetical protein
MTYDITLITCTGNRPKAFKLCEHYVGRQKTGLNIQWIVVNDGNADIESDLITDLIISKKKRKQGVNSLGSNMLLSLDKIQSDNVLFFEDDDWYSPQYVQYYYNKLQKHDLFGQGCAKYYNLKYKNYHVHKNMQHASLCQTGIKTELLLQNKNIFNSNDPFYDIELWRLDVDKYIEFKSDLCIGIKGLHDGLGIGHKNNSTWQNDHNNVKLKEFIGNDYGLYAQK